MKKLLIISQHYPPEIGAASNRMDHIVTHLLQHEINIYLITSQPNYPNPSLYSSNTRDVNHPCLKIYRSPVIRGPLPDKLSRLINQILFLFWAIMIAFFVCIRYSVNICLTTSPPFLVNIVGLVISKVLRAKWIMEVRDLWPDSLLAVDAVQPNHVLFRLLKRLEYLFYKSSNQVVVVTQETKKILISNGIHANKIEVITNGIPDWISFVGSAVKKNVYATNQSFNVIYIGNIGLSQNLGLLLDVASALRDKSEIQFYFVGEGLDKKNLIRRAEDLRLEHVHFIDAITEKEELINWYVKADVGVVSLKDSLLFQSVIPSKIFEYGALGVPILFIGNGEAADIISKYKLGQQVGFEPKEIQQMINQYYSKQNKNPADDPNQNISSLFMDHFSWSQLIKLYLKVIAK